MTMQVRKAVAGLLLVALLAILAAGCGGGSEPAAQAAGANAALAALPSPDSETPAYPGPEETFVGAVEGTGFFLGISIVDGQAAGYVCDGKLLDAGLGDPEATLAALETANEQAVSSWLKGNAEADDVTLEADDGSRFTGAVDGDTLTGSVTLPDGSSHDVTLGRVADDTADGLYRATSSTDEAKLTGGWVRVDGEARGKFVVDIVEEAGGAIGDAIGAVGECVRLARSINASHFSMELNVDRGNVDEAEGIMGAVIFGNSQFNEAGCPDGLLDFDPADIGDPDTPFGE